MKGYRKLGINEILRKGDMFSDNNSPLMETEMAGSKLTKVFMGNLIYYRPIKQQRKKVQRRIDLRKKFSLIIKEHGEDPEYALLMMVKYVQGAYRRRKR